jgi:glycosyltransferase involved in cell wall biosynthesis
VISCLRKAGVEVDERHVGAWEGRRETWNAGIAAGARLVAAETRLLAARRLDTDALIVGYPGHFDLPAARRAARGRAPVVFNPLVSLADTLVSDRGRFSPRSLAARMLRTVDEHAFDSADLVVADTAAHAEFFRTFTSTPVEVCFVGAEDAVFTPGWEPHEHFVALFVGKLIPLHGLETVVEAARIAPEIAFRIVGSGQLDRLLRDRPPNVEHVPWIDYAELPAELHRAGCALGIFGTSAKASRVIPNKAFQALACGTPLVTADTPAARELLSDGESAVLVRPGDAEALAAAIRTLREPEVATKLSAGGRAAYEANASEAVLGPKWRGLLGGLVR